MTKGYPVDLVNPVKKHLHCQIFQKTTPAVLLTMDFYDDNLDYMKSRTLTKSIAFALSLMFVSTMSGAWAAEPDGQSDLARIKHRFKSLHVPSKLNADNPAVQEVIKGIDAVAEAALSSQNMDKSSDGYGSWGKLTKRDGDSLSRFTDRLYKITKAWAFPYSKYHKSDKALTHITAACEYLYSFIKPGANRSGNWWGWDIGAPRKLSSALILLENSLPPKTRDKMVQALTGADDGRGLVKMFYHPNYKGGGANAMDVAFNQMLAACITGNEKYAANGTKLMSILSSKKTDQGIQDDYSYHFHGHGLNMGYGREQIKRVSSFLQLTSGTKFSLSDKAFELFQEWFREFIIFNSYKGHVSPFTIGRSISRNEAVVDPVELEMAMTLYLADGSTCKDLALSFIKEWYDARPKKDFYTATIAALASKVEPRINEAGPMPTAPKFYPVSDYLACRMRRFYAAVRMSSKRTISSFSIRDENIRGHRTGDGTLAVMTDGHEFDSNVIPTMSWYAHSGITAAYGALLEPEKPAHSTIVGGLAHRERTGMAGMDFIIRSGVTLEARKSYTVTPAGILLAGTRIRGSNLEKGKSFYTSLHQCQLRKNDVRMVIDGRTVPVKDSSNTVTINKWLHIRNYGYIFPEPEEIELQINTTQRSYRYINKRHSTDKKYKARFYTLLKHHDVNKLDNEYAVVIIPEISLENMRKLASNSSLELNVKTAKAHLVDDKQSRTRHIYFFEKDEIQGYSASQPLFLSLSRENGKLYVTLQDPSHSGGAVSFGVPFALNSAEENVQIKSVDKGSEVTVTLNKGWQKELVFSIK